MWVALTAGGGAKAPGGRATLVPEDLVYSWAVLIGQGRRIGCCVSILLGIWERWGVVVEIKKKKREMKKKFIGVEVTEEDRNGEMVEGERNENL